LTARETYDVYVVWLLCVSIRDAIASLANQDAAAPQACHQRSFSSHPPIDWLPDFHTHFKASSRDSSLPRSSARNGPVHAGHERGQYRDYASRRAGGGMRDVCVGRCTHSWSSIHLDRRQRRESDKRRPLLPVDRRETLLWNATRLSKSGRLHFKYFRTFFSEVRYIDLRESDWVSKCDSHIRASQ
jgi:hypothetical protein